MKATNSTYSNYPYGMMLPGRHSSSGDYRYGYQGSEMDNEVKGNGNSYTTQFRQYDPRVGRWLSLDPLMSEFADMSPYVSFDNNPIYYTDPTGLYSEKRAHKKAERINNSKKAQKYGYSSEVVYGGEENGYGVLTSVSLNSNGKSIYSLSFGNKGGEGDKTIYVNDFESIEFSDYKPIKWSDEEKEAAEGYHTGLRVIRSNNQLDIWQFENNRIMSISTGEIIGVGPDIFGGPAGIAKKGFSKLSKNLKAKTFMKNNKKANKQFTDVMNDLKIDKKHEFSDYLHAEKARRNMKGGDNFSYKELKKLGKEFLKKTDDK